jgi:hypothetical protein
MANVKSWDFGPGADPDELIRDFANIMHTEAGGGLSAVGSTGLRFDGTAGGTIRYITFFPAVYDKRWNRAMLIARCRIHGDGSDDAGLGLYFPSWQFGFAIRHDASDAEHDLMFFPAWYNTVNLDSVAEYCHNSWYLLKMQFEFNRTYDKNNMPQGYVTITVSSNGTIKHQRISSSDINIPVEEMSAAQAFVFTDDAAASYVYIDYLSVALDWKEAGIGRYEVIE